jgi:hypothetical protein
MWLQDQRVQKDHRVKPGLQDRQEFRAYKEIEAHRVNKDQQDRKDLLAKVADHVLVHLRDIHQDFL